MRPRRWLLSCLIVLLVAATPAAARIARPRTFASCADLVGYAQRNFAVTHGIPEPSITSVAAPVPTAAPLGAANQAPAAAAPAPSASTGAPSFSTTNVQEAGVDEPDIVKTDGTTLFEVGQGKLEAVTVAGATPRLAGTLDLGSDGYDAQLLLRGSRLIVISSTSYAVPVGIGVGARLPAAGVALAPFPAAATTTVREVDVHDPAAMRVTRTMTLDGRFVDARQNGATARLVISSQPQAVGLAGQRGAAAAWIARRRFHSALTGRSYVRPVAPCTTIRRPVQFSGLGMLTIFTLDLDRGLYTADTAALMADAQVVYGSPTSLYVATQRWIDPRLAIAQVPVAQSTVIDKFDVSDPARTTLVATGEVPGYLLNQFSLSEYQGYLRAATTSRPIWWGGGPPLGVSQSTVSVLAQRGGVLTGVGQVSGLGAGQQIYSVRFVEKTGYVVTFHQVDPLYVIDLSSPSAPRVAGQLELAGYSSYLQPLTPGLLLGIGQDVGTQSNEPAGTQLELFDVSNPGSPRLIQRTTLGNGSSSEVQYDHHAFLYWPPTQLAVLPVAIFAPPVLVAPAPPGVAAPSQPAPAVANGFIGAVGYHVDPSGLSEVGRITHDAIGYYQPTIRRSVVVGDRLLTVSDAGVLASSLATLARQTFVAFPTPPAPVPVPLAGRAVP